MNNNKEYWKKKEEMAAKAYEHYIYMGRTFPREINHSINNTILIDNEFIERYHMSIEQNTRPIIFGYDTIISVVNTDSVSAIFQYNSEKGKTAVLNFASYKNPGGMFLKGSTAQEECLCHSSFLYNVLLNKKEYYNWNKKNLNQSLYVNRALYTPDVLFSDNNGMYCSCDVITCAAPNKTSAQKYHNVDDMENSLVLFGRIRFILDIFKMMNIETLILGAFGCGVFGQNSYEVASIFKQLLETEFKNCFKSVVFAIPFSSTNQNLQNFLTVFDINLY